MNNNQTQLDSANTGKVLQGVVVDDEPALADALKRDVIAGAGVDEYELRAGVDEKHVMGSHHRLIYPMAFKMLTNLFRVGRYLGGVSGIDPVQQSRYLKISQLKLAEVRRSRGLKWRGGEGAEGQ